MKRLRRATKLDKARWLIVYSTDAIILLGALGFIDLFVRRQYGLAAPVLVAAVVLLTIFLVLSTRPFRIAVRGGARPTWILAVTGVIALALGAMLLIWPIPSWLGLMAAFVRKRLVIALSVVSIVAVNTAVTVVLGRFMLLFLVVQLGLTVACVGGVWANLRLWRLAVEAHEGQEAMARLAVSEERLRFARDLNDLLGQSLADISARTSDAERTLRVDAAAAAGEMFQVRDLSRRSLREVRSVVQSYRAVDLDEVLASVRAVLEAAGVRCTVQVETGTLPQETRTLLANVVREGATNVLKHSKAERCTITIENGVLEMSNDGVSGPVSEHSPVGLAGLADRVRAAGGTLEARPSDAGRYLLRAAVPA
ncbi:sensor histidine kinase [Nonomuraea jiangxiensis]|uniref:Two-component system, NarL family, sensor histidine kinase DesK n=1 Tax=Nonomuraea jiangxiensis TaxID=633440 RepID=A0A1G8BZB1_9ACTN|nr:histidine kinase [Nonomuraea jiangxiensis]SDH38542.1 two-component system, NarL family, sensor histidine kinase DesK [Nonomuraea jiangxiensis]